MQIYWRDAQQEYQHQHHQARPHNQVSSLTDTFGANLCLFFVYSCFRWRSRSTIAQFDQAASINFGRFKSKTKRLPSATETKIDAPKTLSPRHSNKKIPRNFPNKYAVRSGWMFFVFNGIQLRHVFVYFEHLYVNRAMKRTMWHIRFSKFENWGCVPQLFSCSLKKIEIKHWNESEKMVDVN